MDKLSKQRVHNYWLNKINNFDKISCDFFKGRTEIIEVVNHKNYEYIDKLTNGNSIAEYTVLLSLYNSLLYRYFGNERSVFSIGLGEKNIPLLLELFSTKGESFKTYLNLNKGEVQEVYKNRNYDDKDFSFKSYSNYGLLYNCDNINVDLPFVLNILKKEESVQLRLNFSPEFIEPNLAQHFLNTFKKWIVNLVDLIDNDIEKVEISNQRDTDLIETINDNRLEYRLDNSLIDIFNSKLDVNLDKIGLKYLSSNYTFDELDTKSNQLASYLVDNYNIGISDLIGVKLGRNENLIITILGVLKTGAAYVPIDVNYPKERIDFIENDSDSKLVIDQKFIEQFYKANISNDLKRSINLCKADDIAYVIYTSGSTGNPKGVKITHRNAVAMLNWAKKEFELDNFDIVYATTSHCFDLSIYEIFYPLYIKKPIRLLENALEIKDYINKDYNVLINTVPSSMRNLLDNGIDLNHISSVNLAGEAFPVSIANELNKTSIEVRNLYGPTEDTTYSTCYKLDKSILYKYTVPIGIPIFNTKAWVLDENLMQVPVGVKGKLYLSGNGVTKGYLNRKELTDEKFILNPFDSTQKMYDTGDIARWTFDENLEYIGRGDTQVKLRGYRIELSEIVNTIYYYSNALKEVAVIVKNGLLISYLTSSDKINIKKLESFLKLKMPNFMVPNIFISLKNMPLTVNGKIDIKELEKLEIKYNSDADFVYARNAMEKKLVSIWEDVLVRDNISVKDDFFKIGGHSLLVAQVMNRVYDNIQGEISFKQFFENPTIEKQARLIKNVSVKKIEKTLAKEYYPLTPSQNRIWILSQLEGGEKAYLMSGVKKLKGDFQLNIFESAIKSVVEKHEVLRTNFFQESNGVVIQKIREYAEVEIDLDFTNLEDVSKTEIYKLIKDSENRKFDLEKDLLFDIKVKQIGKNEFLVVFLMHHIIGDGWSLELLNSELIVTYNKILDGTYQKEELDIQYKDYSVWLTKNLSLNKFEDEKTYWLSEYQGGLPILELPTSNKRPFVKTYNGGSVNYTFSPIIYNKLKTFIKDYNITLYMLLFSGINVLLHKYSRQKDIIIGSPITGRDNRQLEEQIGLYLNTIAIRSKINSQMTFQEFVAYEKEQILNAFEYQSYPFDLLVSNLDIERDLSRSPLFDVMVVLQSQNKVSNITLNELEHLKFESYNVDRDSSHFDLSFIFKEEDSLDLIIEFNSDIYNKELVESYLDNFQRLLVNLTDNPKQKIAEIEYLSDTEKNKLLYEFNDTKVNYPLNNNYIELFKQHLEDFKFNDAISFKGETISYNELDRTSDRFASYLIRTFEIKKGDVVAVSLDRSEWLLISFLAILKANAVYLAIAKDSPESRIEFIKKDSGSKLVIDEFFIDHFEELDYSDYSELVNSATPNSPAYIVYTSGTTGKPKGVLVSHKSLINLCFWHKNYTKLNFSQGKSTLFAGTGFDASILEIGPYLLFGHTIFPINDEEIRLDVFKLVQFLESNRITSSFLPTSVCHELVAQNVTLNYTKVLTGGEALVLDRRPNFEIINNYGPSEYTVISTVFDTIDNFDKIPPIGKPISNTSIYVLDENLQLLPKGAVGIIFVSGEGLSIGYLNRPELNSEKFIDNPFVSGTKMYNTGDLGKWLDNGNLMYVGREDQQIKLRGHRIELSGVEVQILSFSKAINEVVVLLKEDKLIAFYSGDLEFTDSDFKNFLKDKLPEYSIPYTFYRLNRIPLNHNGKSDRNKLNNISIDLNKKEYVKPVNEIEDKISEIWKGIFNLPQISTDDDFFKLGGHSLLLTKIVASYQKTFNKRVSISDLYMNTTIQSQAIFFKSINSELDNITTLEFKEAYDLSNTQMRYWLIHNINGPSKMFNIFSFFEFPFQIEIELLEQAFRQLVLRHESLRTYFTTIENVPFQKVLNNYDDKIGVFHAEKEIEDYVFDYEFDLNQFPLFRVGFLATSNKLYFNMHHIIGDGWSMQILQRDLIELYKALSLEREAKLPNLDTTYKDYSYWDYHNKNSSRYKKSKKYWEDKLKEPLDYLQLPRDISYSKNNTIESGSFTTYIDKQLKDKLDDFSSKFKVSIFSVILSGFKVLLHNLTESNDIIVGIPAANRNHYQLENVVGCFLNTLMIRDHFDKNKSVLEWVSTVNESIQEALSIQDYPFENVLEDIAYPKDKSHFPLSPVFINVVDFPEDKKDKILSFENYHEIITSEPKFEIEYYIKTYENGIQLKCVYNNSFYLAETIEFWTKSLLQILTKFTNKEKLPIGKLDVFSNIIEEDIESRPNILFTKFKFNSERDTLFSKFEEQVNLNPELVAVKSDNEEITYKALLNKVNYQTNRFIESNSKGKGRVGLLLPHNEYSLIGMLTAMKLGYTYVPIDVNSPKERIEFILNDANCDYIFYSSLAESKISELNLRETKVFEIKDIDKEEDTSLCLYEVMPENEAYILYTSGSTGKPKGVIQSHKNVLHYIMVYTNAIGINKDDNLSLFSTYSFDASVKDIYGAILNGGTICFYSILNKGLEALHSWINDNMISVLHMVPTLYRTFLNILSDKEKLNSVRLVDLGGESCHKKDLELFNNYFNSEALLVNDYGPTEATIVTQKFYNHKSRVLGNNLSLGKAVENTKVFLLTEEGKEAKIYQTGEIVFESNFLALGYLNRESITKASFTTNPISKKNRVYKSGDIGRLLPNGEIEFVRRKDSQVKLNGIRIELDEVNYHIEKIDAVKESIVLLKKVKEKFVLVAYCCLKEDIKKEEIKASLKNVIPTYMYPNHYVFLDTFPKTRTGKIDKKMLLKHVIESNEKQGFMVASSDIEIELQSILSEILSKKQDEIGIRDNFFELGGNSLQGVILINRINSKYDLSFSISDLYDLLTIEELSTTIEFYLDQNKEKSEDLSLKQSERDDLTI